MQKNEQRAVADAELLVKLRAAVEVAGRVSRDKKSSVAALLQEARATHTTVVGLLHGRIRDLSREKGELEQKKTTLEASLALREQESRDADAKRAAAEADAAETRGRLDAAIEERDELLKRVEFLLVEKMTNDAILAELETTLASEHDEFTRTSKALNEDLAAAVAQVQTLTQEKNAADARVKILDAEVARLGEELARSTSALVAKLRASEDLKEKALRDKAATEERLAKIQVQWERMSR